MCSQLLHVDLVAGNGHTNHNMAQNASTDSLTSWRREHRGIALYAAISTQDTGTGPHTTAKPARHTLHFVLPPVLRDTTPWRTTGDHLQRSSNSCSLSPSLSLPLSHSPSLSLCTSLSFPLAREGVSVYPVKTQKNNTKPKHIYPLTLRNPSCGNAPTCVWTTTMKSTLMYTDSIRYHYILLWTNPSL